MERINTKKLPPIFKMSVLWNILPYYGHIHRWRRLLEKINKETKEIWDNNREQLMYIGRDFKREIELYSLNKNARHLRPNRSWIDLFTLYILYDLYFYNISLAILIANLTEDEVIIVNSHDDIFKDSQIHYWRKDRISDILPAIKCPSFKSETKIFNTSEMTKIREFINNQIRTKSIVIENKGDTISIDLVYGDTLKIMPIAANKFQQTKYFDKLKERYNLWEIEDCACKPKKIRVWANNFENLEYAIEELEKISNINDTKLGVYISYENYAVSFSNCDTIAFNHSVRLRSYKTNLIFTGDKLAAVYDGNYYNFRLDEKTKKFVYSYIKGKI